MAAKKTIAETEDVQTEAVLSDAETEASDNTPAEAAPKDPWEDMREVHLPRAKKNEENYLYVCVNGRSFQVPKGKSVMVPYPIYERIQIMNDALDAEADFRENEIPNEAEPK